MGVCTGVSAGLGMGTGGMDRALSSIDEREAGITMDALKQQAHLGVHATNTVFRGHRFLPSRKLDWFTIGQLAFFASGPPLCDSSRHAGGGHLVDKPFTWSCDVFLHPFFTLFSVLSKRTNFADEPWAAKKERVRLASPHGQRKGWDLLCLMVKSFDDLRQECFAMQIIQHVCLLLLSLSLSPFSLFAVTLSRLSQTSAQPNSHRYRLGASSRQQVFRSISMSTASSPPPK